MSNKQFFTDIKRDFCNGEDYCNFQAEGGAEITCGKKINNFFSHNIFGCFYLKENKKCIEIKDLPYPLNKVNCFCCENSEFKYKSNNKMIIIEIDKFKYNEKNHKVIITLNNIQIK